jgi:hypothetical protein
MMAQRIQTVIARVGLMRACAVKAPLAIVEVQEPFGAPVSAAPSCCTPVEIRGCHQNVVGSVMAQMDITAKYAWKPRCLDRNGISHDCQRHAAGRVWSTLP